MALVVLGGLIASALVGLFIVSTLYLLSGPTAKADSSSPPMAEQPSLSRLRGTSCAAKGFDVVPSARNGGAVHGHGAGAVRLPQPAAEAPDEAPPAVVEPIEGSDLSRITLTPGPPNGSASSRPRSLRARPEVLGGHLDPVRSGPLRHRRRDVDLHQPGAECLRPPGHRHRFHPGRRRGPVRRPAHRRRGRDRRGDRAAGCGARVEGE